MKTLDKHTNVQQTVRRTLPYQFTYLVGRMLQIRNLAGEILLVSHAEVNQILQRDDLDVHRRRMYEAALEELVKWESRSQ